MIQRKGMRNNHLDQKFVQMTIHGRIDDVLSTRGVASRKQVRGPQHNMLTIANVNQDIETILK